MFSSFAPPDNVDDSRVEADFKDGMLTLTLPKSGKAKPRTVEVKVS